MITSKELKRKYLQFFESKGHTIIPSASLLPENDPTALFINSGMHPLVPNLLGEPHPAGKRLVDYQKCIRTGDIDDVGDSTHLTFFEMLGNWSLGDYFKKEAIEWSFEFLTSPEWLNIPLEKLHFTVFAGEDKVPRDEESGKLWLKLGVPEDHIHFLGMADNWWGPAGQTGPCGPDTEMFYDVGKLKCKPDCRPGCGCGKYVEIWNDVFMQYYKDEQGNFNPLEQKNIDTGMGVERTVAVLSGKDNVYEIDEFQEIIKETERLSGKTYDQYLVSFRVIADHIRSAVFILGDDHGVLPSNVDQGYILRRLIRRAVRHGKVIGIEDIFLAKLAYTVINQYQADYPELMAKREKIELELNREEEKFRHTLQKGLKKFEKLVSDMQGSQISGQAVFDLFTTYGFPYEITAELAQERGLTIDEKAFKDSFAKHQELSRKGAEAKFKGGLADASEEVTALHTATHLLHQALRLVLGEQVAQKGSNITPDRLRFDFTYNSKMTAEQIKQTEDIVNEQIKKDLTVTLEEKTVEQAKKDGAIGLFEHKYQDMVKVYTIGNPKPGEYFSKEICGGPHVDKIGGLGHFKIKKEESSGAGVRRIKAVLIKD